MAKLKLKLNLDQLTVDSFDTATAAQEKGTVFGEQCTCYTNCTCPGCPTCDHTYCGQHTCNHTYCGQHTCGNCLDTYNDCTAYPCGPTDVANTCNPSDQWAYACCPV